MVSFGLGCNVQPFSSSFIQILQETCNNQEHELILISSDITAQARASAVPERIFSRPFSEKLSELPFQNFDGL